MGIMRFDDLYQVANIQDLVRLFASHLVLPVVVSAKESGHCLSQGDHYQASFVLAPRALVRKLWSKPL